MKANKTIFIFGALFLLLMTAVYAAPVDLKGTNLDMTLLNQDPDPAVPGDYVELRFMVEKDDFFDIENINFTFLENYPFTVSPDDTVTKEIDSWKGYSTSESDEHYVLYYKVLVSENALQDTYDAKIKVEYDVEGKHISVTRTFDIRIDENTNPRLVTGSTTSTPEKLMADTDDNEVTVEILNIGEEKAKNVLAEITLPDGFTHTYSGGSKINLGNIEGDSSKDLMLYINIDDELTQGSYEGSIKLNYQDEDNADVLTVILPVTFEVKSKPLFKVNSVDISKEVVQPGDVVSLTFDIENIGLEKAESVSVRAYKESSQPFEFDDKSDFLGTIYPTENGQGVLTLTVDSDAESKKYLLDIEIRSVKDDTVFLQEEVASLTVQPKERSFASLIMVIVGLLVVVLIAYLSYRYGKNSK